MKPCLLLVLPHPSACRPCLRCKIVQIARNPAEVREGRGWVRKNMKKKMRRSWFFLTSSTGWPLSSASVERWSYLSAPCRFLVRCTQNGSQDSDGWIEGWMDRWKDGWTDGQTQLDTQHILSSLFSHFSNFSIQICMPCHLSLPLVLTADEKVLFRTQGLSLVF